MPQYRLREGVMGGWKSVSPQEFEDARRRAETGIRYQFSQYAHGSAFTGDIGNGRLGTVHIEGFYGEGDPPPRLLAG